ncbi:hypothetical protein ACFJIV_17320 [Mucilaginibacter sp. UC70_90]
MKTSNKFLLTAVLLLIVSVGIYDVQLKAEYFKGEYKNPYNGFNNLNFRNFKVIELGSSTAINIMLVQGPFKVLADPGAMEFMKIEQRHDSLFIRAEFKDNFHNVQSPNVLYISMPQLNAFMPMQNIRQVTHKLSIRQPHKTSNGALPPSVVFAGMSSILSRIMLPLSY